MIEDGNKGKINRHMIRRDTEAINIFNEVNLKNIFSNEEIETLIKEPGFLNDEKENSILNSDNNISDNEDKKKKKLLNCNRMTLIVKFLNTSIKKLKNSNENIIAKGLEW
jgi:hypothetical protein